MTQKQLIMVNYVEKGSVKIANFAQILLSDVRSWV